MASSNWTIHYPALEKMFLGEIDWDIASAFSVRLYSSASNIETRTILDATTVSNELATANGYTNGGEVQTIVVSETAGIVNIDGSDAQWAATGAGITARFAGLVYTQSTPDYIIGYTTLDTAGGGTDVTAVAGNTFTVQIAGVGFANISATP